MHFQRPAQPAYFNATASSQPAKRGRAESRWFWLPSFFFAGIIGTLVLLLLEMRSVQQQAQAFVRSHGRVAHLEEQLSTTVRVAAATSHRELAAQYRMIELEVGAALKQAADAGQALGLTDYLAIRAGTDAGQTVGESLAALESRVLELVKQGDNEQARALAEGSEYAALRRSYAEIGRALDDRIDDMLRLHLTVRYSAVLLLFLALGVGALMMARLVINRIRRQRDQILSLMEATNAAKDEAEVASRAKGAFLATMSHEIRTPLTAIVGFADVLLEPNNTKDERIAAAGTIRRNAGHLLSIINDILDMSKIEAVRLEVEAIACSPAQILRDVEQMLAGKAQEKQLTFRSWSDSELPSRIVSDPTRIKQALINLVSNAIKFTRAGGVRVVASCDPRKKLLVIRVEDDGIGMSREQVQRLFNPFTQADNSMTRRFGGTGLGLFITKNITEKLGGSLALESAPGKGSAFTLSLPTGPLDGVEWAYLEARERDKITYSGLREVANHVGPAMVAGTRSLAAQASPGSPTTPATSASPAVESSASAAVSGPLAGARILLVEDGVDNQRLISMILKRQGATVDIAEHGEIGLHKALTAWRAHTPFDLILMDMQMPVMDGYTAAGELRNQGYPFQILALTAHALKGEQQQCIDAGCDICLTKPIDKPTFFREVGARLRQPTSWTPSPLASAGEAGTGGAIGQAGHAGLSISEEDARTRSAA